MFGRHRDKTVFLRVRKDGYDNFQHIVKKNTVIPCTTVKEIHSMASRLRIQIPIRASPQPMSCETSLVQNIGAVHPSANPVQPQAFIPSNPTRHHWLATQNVQPTPLQQGASPGNRQSSSSSSSSSSETGSDIQGHSVAHDQRKLSNENIDTRQDESSDDDYDNNDDNDDDVVDDDDTGSTVSDAMQEKEEKSKFFL